MLFPAKSAWLSRRGVEILHIGRMVLVMMDPHRLFVDVGLEGSVIVRQRRQFVGHGTTSPFNVGRLRWSAVLYRVCSVNAQHAVECHTRPVFFPVRHDDPVVDLAGE